MLKHTPGCLLLKQPNELSLLQDELESPAEPKNATKTDDLKSGKLATTKLGNTVSTFKGCVRYIFGSLFFKSKKEHL